MAYCNLCSANFSIASGGLNDIKKHSSSDHYIKAKNCKKTSITNFVSNAQSTLEKSVIRAETMLAFAVAEHNLPLSVADHFSDMVKMFPANQIAANFACKKTKCTQIVKLEIR